MDTPKPSLPMLSFVGEVSGAVYVGADEVPIITFGSEQIKSRCIISSPLIRRLRKGVCSWSDPSSL
jgi:hypothetical protein